MGDDFARALKTLEKIKVLNRKSSGPDGIRTHGLRLRRPVHYPLCYGSTANRHPDDD